MKKILPIRNPFIRTYQYTSSSLAVTLVNSSSYPFLLNSFIQLMGWKKYCADFDDYWFFQSPVLECQRYGKDMILSGWSDYSAFIRDAIDHGYYLYLCVNVKDIPAYHNSEAMAHDLLIFGYDNAQRVFHIADHFDDGKFSLQTAAYEDVLQAMTFEQMPEHQRIKYDQHFIFSADILTFRNKNSTEASLDATRIKQSISNYLGGKPTNMWYTKPLRFWIPENTEQTLFGIKCYRIIDYHLAYTRQHGHLHEEWRKTLSIFTDHKKAMYLRFCYMSAHKYLRIRESHCQEQLLEIYRMSLKGINLALKFNIKASDNCLAKITNIYHEMEQRERTLYPCLMEMMV